MIRPTLAQQYAITIGWIAAGLRSRRLWRATLVLTVAATLVLGYEAAFRARLTTPEARVPTSLYTRPTSWGNGPQDHGALPIGPLASGAAEYRIPVRLDEMPDHLVQAVLAVEDQRFHRHSGLDFRRIAGALVANLRSGGITQGGSTITQQLAKNLFLHARRTPLRKLREAAMAVALEDRYDKSTILEAYLNEIYLGQDGGDAIHGVGAAARYYFGKPVSDVTLGEAALLAGMIRSPNRTTPIRHPTAARERRDLVLDLMVAQDRISPAQSRRASRERLRSRPSPRQAVQAPWFRDLAVSTLEGRAGRISSRGAAVYTSIDATLQRAANRAVQEGLVRFRSREVQAALVALDPRTGEVLALVGGRDYATSQFNRVVQARRQPGSAFKPIVALAALGRQGGEDPQFTLASVLRDEPVSIDTPAGRWEPGNFDHQFRGSVTFREALEQSLNVPFVRVGLAIGPDRIVRTARALGITSPMQAVPSLALGAAEVSPFELTRAFGVLAAGGRLAEPVTVLGVVEADGTVRDRAEASVSEVVSPAEAYLVTSGLEGVIERGTGRGLAELAGWGGLAGKSGTSNDFRDAWFVAYTPAIVVGVWVGFDDGRSVGLSGARSALPIVARFLREALDAAGSERFAMPEGVETARVAGGEAGWAGWGCAGRLEVFLEGTAPEPECRWYDLRDRWRGRFEGSAEELLGQLERRGERYLRRLLERVLER